MQDAGEKLAEVRKPGGTPRLIEPAAKRGVGIMREVIAPAAADGFEQQGNLDGFDILARDGRGCVCRATGFRRGVCG